MQEVTLSDYGIRERLVIFHYAHRQITRNGAPARVTWAQRPRRRRKGTRHRMRDFREMLTPMLVALNLADGDSPPVGSVGADCPIALYCAQIVRPN